MALTLTFLSFSGSFYEEMARYLRMPIGFLFSAKRGPGIRMDSTTQNVSAAYNSTARVKLHRRLVGIPAHAARD